MAFVKPVYLPTKATKAASSLNHLNVAHQRAILGVTALAIQPLIDLSNKDVDAETRKISVARTILKILVGTGVGVLVRGAAFHWAKHAGRDFILKDIVKNFNDYKLTDYADQAEKVAKKIAKFPQELGKEKGWLKNQIHSYRSERLNKKAKALKKSRQSALETINGLDWELAYEKSQKLAGKPVDEKKLKFINKYIHSAANTIATMAVVFTTLTVDGPVMSWALKKFMPGIKSWLDSSEKGGS